MLTVPNGTMRFLTWMILPKNMSVSAARPTKSIGRGGSDPIHKVDRADAGSSCLPLQPSEPPGLQQQRPGEGGDGLVGVEVAGDERLGDRPDRGRRRTARLLAAPQLPGRAQLQHGGQITERLGLGVPNIGQRNGFRAHDRTVVTP